MSDAGAQPEQQGLHGHEPGLSGVLPGVSAHLPDSEFTLLELADRLLHKGVVLVGEATISVAGVDLVYLGLNVVLSAVENLRPGALDAALGEAARGMQGEHEAQPPPPDPLTWRE